MFAYRRCPNTYHTRIKNKFQFQWLYFRHASNHWTDFSKWDTWSFACFSFVLVAAAEQLIRDGCCGPADVAIGDPGDVRVT